MPSRTIRFLDTDRGPNSDLGVWQSILSDLKPLGFSACRLGEKRKSESSSSSSSTTTNHPTTKTLLENQTHFGFVSEAPVDLIVDGRCYPLVAGMYFMTPGPITIRGEGNALVISDLNRIGLFSIGGPIENTGRLRYIDGCSDTLLISPTVKGDPCLNFLKLPPNTNQTSHVHPSFRLGVIVSGSGHCDGPSHTQTLTAGKIFYIPANCEHRFRTQNQSLSVIAFHPDSDFGPWDDDHPMVNKTIVDGTPAAQLTHDQRRISADGSNRSVKQ